MSIVKYNGKVVRSASGKWIGKSAAPQLPPRTIRFKFYNTSYVPTSGDGQTDASKFGTWTEVDASTGVWDWTNTQSASDYSRAFDARMPSPSDRWCEVVAIGDLSEGTNFAYMFSSFGGTEPIPWFDTSNATNLEGLFYYCSNVPSFPALDTSKTTTLKNYFGYCQAAESFPAIDATSATTAYYMCSSCYSLKQIPTTTNTDNLTTVRSMFSGCRAVESGALALYNQLSSQAVPPSETTYCFYNCGKNTVTGAAELAQIPSDWK